MSKTKHVKGEYTDQEVIAFINKYAPKGKPFNIFTFKTIGKTLQKKLKEMDLTTTEIKEYVVTTILNPPVAPPEPVVVKPSKEELQETMDNEIREECKYTSFMKEGKEVLQLSEKGMKHLERGDHDEFENVGKATLDDHEDDGRIFKTQTVKRLSDGKQFYYNFIWHHEYDSTYWDNQLTELGE